MKFKMYVYNFDDLDTNPTEIKLYNKSYTDFNLDVLKTFKSLKTFEISACHIKIPEIIGDFEQLTALHFDKCKIVDLPDSIALLQNLELISLCENYMTEFPEVLTITKTKYLYMHENIFFRIPQFSKEAAENLVHVDFSRNALTDFPMTNCVNLTCIWLKRNSITHIPESVKNLINVETIDLKSNALRDIPDFLFCLPKLRFLNVKKNILKKLPDFTRESNLTDLNLSDNRLIAIPESIDKCKTLEELILDSNELTEVPSSVGNMSALRCLVLSNNELKSLPASFIKLKSSLILLNLEGNPMQEYGSNGNLGKRDLRLIFGDRVIFTNKKSIKFRPVSEASVLTNYSKKSIRWNLDKMKLLITNEFVPQATFTENEMLSRLNYYLELSNLSQERKDLLQNYVRKLFNVKMEYSRWAMQEKYVPQTKAILEEIFKKFSEMQKTESEANFLQILESNLKCLSEAVTFCPDRQFSELRFVYNLLCENNLSERDNDIYQIIEKRMTFLKEQFFDIVFTPATEEQNVHVLNYWKYELRENLGFNFNFITSIGTMGQDPFQGEHGNALEAFLTLFAPRIIIPILVEEVNSSSPLLCKFAEYVYNVNVPRSVKLTWANSEDDDFLTITKIYSPFIEHLLVKLNLLIKT